MSIRDDDLIDYLMGEADAVLIRRIQLALQSDAQVAIRLDELRAALGLLDSMKSVIEPPSGLAQRTLSFIDQHVSDQQPGDQKPKVRLRSAEVGWSESRSSRRVWESAFATVALAACACLMLPLVVDARSLSRELRCRDNLHKHSTGLTEIAMLTPERRFPEVPKGRLDSFPGRFVLLMNDHGLCPLPEQLRCYRLPGRDAGSTEIVCLPTSQEFFNASDAERAWLRRSLGGDYAYNYGILVNGRIVGLPLDGGSHMALLGDAPEVVGDTDMFNGHDGRGINVCFADGHVGLQKFSARELRQKINGRSFIVVNDWQSGDYPFRNLEGRRAPGLNIHDASLGPSDSEPQ